uniref:Family with sequence similarity 169 member Aa n=1 Tax=Sphaeramia orbicularis TaxID=375764 RepID=A0A673BUA0_9TELE
MKFPVDLLAHVSQEELERSAQNYMNTLLYSNPDSPESITLSDSTEAIINISTVGFIPLYGSSDKQKILALFTGPTDPFTPVALYLLNQWWTISDILKTEDNDRDGAVEVQTVGERIVLYSLNRVIYRAKEMSSEELPFLCHGETDYAKILWHNGEAVGFYSVKPSGSLCSSFSTRSYQLPVMDSIFVRKCHRGNGYGLQMLKDYVLSFTDSSLGLRYPLATAMYKVCQKYLSQYPGDADLLWEVQSIGGPNQRTNIAKKIQVMDLSGRRHNKLAENGLHGAFKGTSFFCFFVFYSLSFFVQHNKQTGFLWCFQEHLENSENNISTKVRLCIFFISFLIIISLHKHLFSLS